MAQRFSVKCTTTYHIMYVIELINLFLFPRSSSSEISEESELQLTTKMNEVIKQRWVALGPRNYGKSIEWKLEGEPWDTEGLYADHTRGIYLLCLLLEAIQPLGWRLVSSAGKRRSLLQHHLGLRRPQHHHKRPRDRPPGRAEEQGGR